MSTKCKNCKANPSTDSTVHLKRISPKGIIGEWICTSCLEDMETFEGAPHFIHNKYCPGYCDYACNSQGFDLAEQVKKHLKD